MKSADFNAPLDSLSFGDVSKTKLKDDSLIYWGDEPIGNLKRHNIIQTNY